MQCTPELQELEEGLGSCELRPGDAGLAGRFACLPCLLYEVLRHLQSHWHVLQGTGQAVGFRVWLG